jgi:UDP-glucose 4-epimerase
LQILEVVFFQRWRVLSLRYFNPIGAHSSGRIGEYPKGIPKNIIPYLSQVAIGKLEKFSVFGDDYPTPDGSAIRDYSHVVDIAEGKHSELSFSSFHSLFSPGHLAALSAIEAGKVSTGFNPFNLGCGKGISVFEMLRGFSAACGKEIPFAITPRRAGDVPRTCADPSKAEETFGWKATRGVKEMCEDSWRWQKMNPNGYEESEK